MNRFENEPNPNSDDVLVASYLFDELGPGERASFEARLAHDPRLATRVAEFAATRDLIHGALVGADRGGDILSPATHAALSLAARRPGTSASLARLSAAAAILVAAAWLLARDARVAAPERRIEDSLVATAGATRLQSTPAETTAPTPEIQFGYVTTQPISQPTIDPASLATLTIENPVLDARGLTQLNQLEHDRLYSLRQNLAANVNGIVDPNESIGAGLFLNRLKQPVESLKAEYEAPMLVPLPTTLDIVDAEPEGSATREMLESLVQNGYIGVSAGAAHDLPAIAATRLDSASVLRSCERRPNERPADMFFRFWGDNAFERAVLDPISTFSIDVDTASYTLACEYLQRGLVPEKAQIRTEEFVNAFAPDLAAPATEPLAVSGELAPSPFGGEPDRKLLRVVIRAREIEAAKRPPLHLMLVVDNSGSMEQENRLELVKHALRLLVAKLEPRDTLGIVRFNDTAAVVLPPTSANERATIESAIQSMTHGGSTNAEAGLALGFAQLGGKFDIEATNRVVLFSDGVANVGNTTAESILATVAAERAKGIYLSTIGVGMGNHNDVLLEQLADRGDGECAYVDDAAEAKRAIVERFTGAFVPVARNVKVQVEFDPAQVGRYRLLGYENRSVADQDFRNDAVDAGELCAGDQVTALYEIEPAAAFGNGEKPAATIQVRWLPPHGQGDTATETATTTLATSATFDAASKGFRRSALVAQFAEFLRRSTHATGDSLDALLASLQSLAPQLADPEFDRFTALAAKSRDLIAATLPKDDALRDAIDAVRKNRILRAEIEDRAGAQRAEILKQLEEENRRLEELLKKLLGE